MLMLIKFNNIFLLIFSIALCTKYSVYYNPNEIYQMEDKPCKSNIHIYIQENQALQSQNNTLPIKPKKPKKVIIVD